VFFQSILFLCQPVFAIVLISKLQNVLFLDCTVQLLHSVSDIGSQRSIVDLQRSCNGCVVVAKHFTPISTLLMQLLILCAVLLLCRLIYGLFKAV